MVTRSEDGSVTVVHGTGEKEVATTFRNRKIILPSEASKLSELFGGRNVVRIGMTGYSSITEENCREWGIRPGAYEAAAGTLLKKTVRHIQAQFPGAKVILTHGSSDMGVDRAVIGIGEQCGIEMVGFNCEAWAKYVPDRDNFPMYVAETQAEYAEAFIQNLDILLCAGGRLQALEHDMNAAVRYNKRLILANILRAISDRGGPPARDGKGNIVDATAAFEDCLFIQSLASRSRGVDRFGELQNYVFEAVDQVGRYLFEPAVAFSN